MRLTEISAYCDHCPPARPSELSKISSTAARASAWRFPEPLKITSCIESPRSADARDSPSTQRTASMTLDFPQPFGPTTPTSWPGTWIEVGSTKDLNPESFICVSRTQKMITSARSFPGGFSVPSRPSKRLETFVNPAPERDYRIHMEIPEFTCLCPMTGQPDFATLRLDYVPDRRCVELKSLKLYVWSYRNEGAFHEALTNKILNDLVTA